MAPAIPHDGVEVLQNIPACSKMACSRRSAGYRCLCNLSTIACALVGSLSLIASERSWKKFFRPFSESMCDCTLLTSRSPSAPSFSSSMRADSVPESSVIFCSAAFVASSTSS